MGGGQNLINKCHRWKEWKYVNSRLAFTQQFYVYTNKIEVPILNTIGVLILLIVAENGNFFFGWDSRVWVIAGKLTLVMIEDDRLPGGTAICHQHPDISSPLIGQRGKELSSYWLNRISNSETWVQMLLRAFCPPHLGCQSECDFCLRHASLNSFQPCSN